MQVARLFRNGRSQAVRLPKEYQFAGKTVLVKRIGNAVVLLPPDSTWQVLVDSLDCFSADFMEKRDQPSTPQEREVPFA